MYDAVYVYVPASASILRRAVAVVYGSLLTGRYTLDVGMS